MDKQGKIALIVALVLVVVLLASLTIAKPGSGAAKECNDKIDNDGDGDIDLADAGCDSKQDNDESNCGDSVCEGGEVCDVCIADCGECPEPDSCSDTDGGIVAGIQGTASGYLNETYYSNTDYCLGNSTVFEYYCSGDYEYSVSVGCGSNSTCSNGACA